MKSKHPSIGCTFVVLLCFGFFQQSTWFQSLLTHKKMKQRQRVIKIFKGKRYNQLNSSQEKFLRKSPVASPVLWDNSMNQYLLIHIEKIRCNPFNVAKAMHYHNLCFFILGGRA